MKKLFQRRHLVMFYLKRSRECAEKHDYHAAREWANYAANRMMECEVMTALEKARRREEREA